MFSPKHLSQPNLAWAAQVWQAFAQGAWSPCVLEAAPVEQPEGQGLRFRVHPNIPMFTSIMEISSV